MIHLTRLVAPGALNHGGDSIRSVGRGRVAHELAGADRRGEELGNAIGDGGHPKAGCLMPAGSGAVSGARI